MTNLLNIKNATKNELLRTGSLLVILIIIGWGVVSFATDDIKSATTNFSAMGIVSEISEGKVVLSEAKGSDLVGKTSYNLNIDHLENITTSTYIPLNLSDVKVGDKIIAQGLTNGNTFFIKRIISFTSIPTPVLVTATSTVTTTDETIATSTASSTETNTDSVVTPEVSIPSPEDETISATTTEPASSTGEVLEATTTASSTEDISTASSTSEVGPSGTADMIVGSVVDGIQTVVESITTVIEDIVDSITGDTTTEQPTSEQSESDSTPVPTSGTVPEVVSTILDIQ